MKLYELSDSYNQVQALLESDTDNEALKDTLDLLEVDFESKVESCIKLARSKESEMSEINREVSRLQARSAKLEKDANWLHDYVFNEMVATNKEEIKSSLFTIKLANNPQKVNVSDESKIPYTYFKEKMTRSLDKRTLLNDLKEGKTVEGAEIVQDRRLSVK